MAILPDFVLGSMNGIRGLKKPKKSLWKGAETCALESSLGDIGGSCIAPLFAGQHDEVGTVTVEVDGDVLTFTYEIEPPLVITEFHFYIGNDPPDKSAPGQFPVKQENIVMTQDYPSYVWTKLLSDLSINVDCPIIAAHAVVERMDYLDEFNFHFPETNVTMQLALNPPDSYWKATVTDSDIFEAGTFYDDWCIDTENSIASNMVYDAVLYSSDDLVSLPPNLVKNPDNFDLVNWILNQDFVGKPSTGCEGNYTYGEVQRAIWILLENDNTTTAGLGTIDECRWEEIVSQAEAEGEGYKPLCGGVIAVILDPDGISQITLAQITVAEVVVECGAPYDETAWALPDPNCPFDQGWGVYYKCCFNEPPT